MLTKFDEMDQLLERYNLTTHKRRKIENLSGPIS